MVLCIFSVITKSVPAFLTALPQIFFTTVSIHDIISAEEKEAEAKPTFTFPASFIDASPTACVARIKRT